MKQRIAAAALLTAVSLAAAGCSSSGDTGSAKNPVQATQKPKASTIRYQVQDPEDAGTLALLKASVAQFEQKNPDVTVKLETVPIDQQRSVIQTQLRSGSGPDVFQYDTGPGYAGALAKAGLLYDLTDAYTTNKWPIYDFAKQRVTFGGKVLGIPQELELIGGFYNKDLFAANGLSAPASVADIESDGAALRAKGITPITFGNKPGWPAFHIFSMALASAVGPEKVQALLDGTASWDSPDVVRVLGEVFGTFKSDGLYPKSPNALSYEDANALFYNGKAAMDLTGTWLISDLATKAKFSVGFFAFPNTSGPGVFTGGLGAGTFVSASTKSPDAAVRFVGYLTSAERGRYEIEKLQRIPAFPVSTDGATTSPLFASVVTQTAGFANGSAKVGANIDVNMPDVFNKALSDGVQALLNGSTSTAKLAQSLQRAAKS